MESHRITKKIFTWDFDYSNFIQNWNSNIFKVFSTLNNVELYNNLLEVDLKLVKKQQWAAEIMQIPKLRT